MMIIIWLLLITNIQGQEANRTDDEEAPRTLNVTLLYPVSKKIRNPSNNTSKILDGRTTWKLEASYAETNLEKKPVVIPEEKDNIKPTTEEGVMQVNDNIGITDEEEKKINNNITINEGVVSEVINNGTINEEELREYNNNIPIIEEEARGINECKDFKPSQHLGSFLDGEELPEAYGAPSNGEEPGFQFVSLHENGYNSPFKPSPESIQIPKDVPYKFDNTLYRTKDIWKPDVLEPIPTVEIPVHVPAGGLYKLEDPFGVHPSILHSDSNEDFTHKIKDNLKGNYIKKRVDPWRNVLRLMTALVPAGLIVSALTPSVINIHSTGPEARHRSRFVRRSYASEFELPAINEQCRRRLLCELHSEVNYRKSQSERRKGTLCYKIQCDDPQAVWRLLHWLLTYHQPESKDERGRYFS